MFSPQYRMRGAQLLAIILSAVPLLSLLIAGDFPVYTRGEGREGLVVRALLEGDSLILPLRNGLDIPSKPPLYHWCAAALTKIGIFEPELALRLPSALFGLAAGVILFRFLRARYGDALALTVTAITACSFEWLRAAQSARVDMTFSALLVIAAILLYRLCEERSSRSHLVLLSGLTMAGACLAKGPAGIAIPLAIAGIFSLLSVERLRRNFIPLTVSALIAVGISAVWYYLAYKTGGQKFLDVQLLKENLARIAGDDDYELGHESSAISVVGLLLVGTLPFSLLLLPLIRGTWRHRRSIFKDLDPFFVFSLIEIGVFLCVFGIASSKRGVYLVGCFPAFAYILSKTMLRLVDLDENSVVVVRRFTIWIFALLAIICSKALLAVIFARGFVLEQISSPTTNASVSDLLAHPGVIPGLGVVVLILWALTFDQARRTAIDGVWAIAGLVGVIASFASCLVLPVIADQQSPKYFLTSMQGNLIGSARVFMDDAYFAANYYSPRQLLPLTNSSAVDVEDSALVLSRLKRKLSPPSGFQVAETISTSPRLDVQGRDRLVLQRLQRSVN